MAFKHLILLCSLVSAGVCEDVLWGGQPPTIVNGLRCYWKYTCFIPVKFNFDIPCNLYVPQKFCEEVNILVKPESLDKTQVNHLGSVAGYSGEDSASTTTEGVTESTTIIGTDVTGSDGLSTNAPMPPPKNPFVIIDAPVNCEPGFLPDPNGKCKINFGK